MYVKEVLHTFFSGHITFFMGRKGKRTEHLNQYQHDEDAEHESDEHSLTEIIEFAIALIYCGFPEVDAQEFDILNGHHPPTYRQITRAINLIRPFIKMLAEQSAEYERERMPENSGVCADGSWDHRRDGKLLVYDIISILTKKIIDFDIQIRKSAKRKGNTTVSPQAMEGAAFENILPRLMSNSKINELVKDGDLEVESIIKNSGWKIIIRPDTNHLLKHFKDNFKSAIKPYGFLFRGICDKVLKQLTYILYENTQTEEKIQKIHEMKTYILTQPLLKYGRSTEKHVWKYANDANAKIGLDKVIQICIQIASTFNRGHSTSLNESFHYMKAKFLPKNYNLGNTGDVRVYAAILQYNIGDEWLERIYDQFNLPHSNIESLKNFRHRAHAILRGLRENDDYFAKKQKKDEEKYQNYIQLQADKRNGIPIHS